MHFARHPFEPCSGLFFPSRFVARRIHGNSCQFQQKDKAFKGLELVYYESQHPVLISGYVTVNLNIC